MLTLRGLTDVVFKHVLLSRHAQLQITLPNAKIYTFRAAKNLHIQLIKSKPKHLSR